MAMAYENKTGLPSVTDILSPYIETRWFTDECRDRGTAVHSSCDAHMKGLYAPKLQAGWQLYVESFLRWMDMCVDAVVLSEVRLRDDRLRYCGKPDAIVTLKGSDKLVLADWKTSQGKQKWWELQNVAYRKLSSVHGFKTDRGLSVRLKKDGGMAIVDEYSGYGSWNIFIGLLNSHIFFYGGNNNGFWSSKQTTG